ncbi:poly-gamma-glutamate synthesis protein (capsule biosynthesis protein) [Fontibacillus phaseoli]|uniref:Poly-gamma-glutamate synthesis protein (Capsule biosynthesis protein) n=1 Tax=Fontibacillus phaseoli TaxID=1416533 RepID=A0A369BJH1_9BACL|nr:CapA family protein [Fontibacillus phaseoli]RCX21752.1 poly-gamma-glutamate synthesis protein (capsule biosynthesis protein) [Fontibacillus phaseoli]
MYPPRSEKHKNKKQEKQRRQSRFWLGLNVSLILIIVVVGAYIFLADRTMKGSADSENGNLSSEIHEEENDLVGSGNQQDPASGDQEPDGDPVVQKPADSGNSSESDPEDDLTGENDQQVPEEDPVQETDSADRLLIHFAGDTIFSSKVAEKLEKEGYDYPYRYVKDLFQNDDLSIVNLETPITDGGTAAENKTFVFKSSPKALPELAKAGIDAVNLANNHTLDQGIEGLLDTIQHLKKSKLRYVGAGKNGTDAYAPLYIERKGIKIALCGFTRVIPESHWTAGKNPGVAAAYDPKQALKSIQNARKNADLVLVMVHWGKERATKLEKHQTELAHAFIDAGADLVVGGHPHVLQGLEEYKGKWIAYSTGNFIFTKSKDPKTWETAVFAAECTRKGDCNMKLIPYRTELGQPVPMNDEEGAKLLKEVEGFSPGVAIEASGKVKSVAVKSGRTVESTESSDMAGNT